MNCLLCHTDIADLTGICPYCAGSLGWRCDACLRANPSPFLRCRGCGMIHPEAASARASSFLSALPLAGPAHGERKLVTVLFADIRGSMALVSGRDPEQADDLLEQVIAQMVQAVHSFGGTVSRIMGDGIMALFGAPLATEHHAIKACLAALWMRDGVARNAGAGVIARNAGAGVIARNAGAEAIARDAVAKVGPITLRIGLASGEVVVKPVAASNFTGYEANGEVVHLAARLEQAAPTNTILLTADTRRLVAGYFDTATQGRIPIRGLAEKLEVWALGARRAQRGARHLVAQGYFLEREAALRTVHTARAAAAAGQGRVVSITGEAGIGKSRLVTEALRQDFDGWLVLRGQAQPFVAKGFRVVTDLLENFLGLTPGDDTAHAFAQLRTRLAGLGQETLCDALAALLGLDQLSARWRALAPEIRRERMRRAPGKLLAALSARQPVVVVVEDLHWLDPASAAVLADLAEQASDLRLLLLATFRPAVRPDWGERPHHARIALDPLTDAAMLRIVTHRLAEGPGTVALAQTLIGRCGGNPLFLEEMLATLVDAGKLLPTGEHLALTQAVADTALPETIRGILAERVDRLNAVDKEVLESAAIIGLLAPIALINTMRGEDADTPPPARLLEGGFLETMPAPNAVLRFRHALMREVVYAGILRRRRIEMHGRVLAAMKHLYRGRLNEYVEDLADHAARAGSWQSAAEYAERAAVKAVARDANSDAVHYYQLALDWLARCPDSAAHRARVAASHAADLHLAIRDPLIRLGRVAEIVHHLDAAEPMVRESGDTSSLGLLHAHRANVQTLQGQSALALRTGAIALALGRAAADPALQARARFQIGLENFIRGAFTAALDAFEDVRRYRAHAPGDHRYGLASGTDTAAHGYAACAHAARGQFDAALRDLAAALRLAEARDTAFDWQFACAAAGRVHGLRGAHRAAMPWLERALGYCQRGNIPVMASAALVALGAARVRAGATIRGLADIHHGIGEIEALGLRAQLPAAMLALGSALLRTGDIAGATTAIQRALGLARAHEQRAVEARALFLLGECGRRGASGVEVQACLHAGLGLSRQLGMAPLTARLRAMLTEPALDLN